MILIFLHLSIISKFSEMYILTFKINFKNVLSPSMDRTPEDMSHSWKHLLMVKVALGRGSFWSVGIWEERWAPMWQLQWRSLIVVTSVVPRTQRFFYTAGPLASTKGTFPRHVGHPKQDGAICLLAASGPLHGYSLCHRHPPQTPTWFTPPDPYLLALYPATLPSRPQEKWQTHSVCPFSLL